MRTGWPFLLYTPELSPDEARLARWYTTSPWPAAVIAILAVAAAIVTAVTHL